MSDAQIRRLSEQGWRRLRRGWHATPHASSNVVEAITRGGVLACTSALRRAGVWVPRDRRVHVRYSKHIAYVGRNCRPFRHNPPTRVAVDSTFVALESAANCLPPESLIVVFDSMLNRGMIEPADVRTICHSSRFAHLNLDARCDGRSESGTETMVRLRLRARRIHTRIQVPIPTIGRVDLLIGTHLIIEVDSRRYHHSKYQADRTRDRQLIALGYTVVRLTYEDVVDQWEDALADLLTIIRRGIHTRANGTGFSQQ